MDNFILNDEQYTKLKKEYAQTLTPSPQQNLMDLYTIIQILQSKNFGLPIAVQSKILNSLQQAHQILSIACTNTSHAQSTSTPKNNPFGLIKSLCTISKDLTSIPLKSPYQTIYLKANSLITDCTIDVLSYFENKNIKIYKFI